MRPVALLLSSILVQGCSCERNRGEELPAASPPPSPDAAVQVAPSPETKSLVEEAFGAELRAPDWTRWRHHLDAKASAWDFGPEGLTASLETYGRAADEVSVLALRFNKALGVVAAPHRVTLELEWLEDSNANYLSAGLALVPQDSPDSGDPRDAAEGVHLSFIGAGDEGRVRRELVVNRRGSAVHRDTEGWPKEGLGGRRVGLTKWVLTVGASVMRLEEPGREPISVSMGPGFSRGRLVLFVASHSNSMRRSVRFRRLSVESLD